jgi:hypothetical protein
MAITKGQSSTGALDGSTETEQFVERIPGIADRAPTEDLPIKTLLSHESGLPPAA